LHPIYENRVFWAVIFFELNLKETLKQSIVPKTINSKKYKFIRVIYPESPLSGGLGDSLYEENNGI